MGWVIVPCAAKAREVKYGYMLMYALYIARLGGFTLTCGISMLACTSGWVPFTI
jgi:hypothetical protein